MVMQQPLRSDRYPYTTLFRSQPRVGDPHAARTRRAADGEVPGVHRRSGPRRDLAEDRPGLPAAADAAADRRGADRKSTRLNSSHLVISYAVFCLKKKTNCMIS